jgi:hypothetical protein
MAGDIELEAWNSRLAFLLLTLASGLMFAGAVGLLIVDPSHIRPAHRWALPWAPSAGVVLFAGTLLYAVHGLFDRRLQLRIDASGLYLRRHGAQVIPWPAIDRVGEIPVEFWKMLSVYLVNPSRYPPDPKWFTPLLAPLQRRPPRFIVIQTLHLDRRHRDIKAALADHLPPGAVA